MSEHPPVSPKNNELDKTAVDAMFEDIVTNFNEEAQEPDYEALKTRAAFGQVALEGARLVKRSEGMTTDQLFWSLSPDEMDAMSDEEILDLFYKPEELGRDKSPNTPAVISEVSKQEPEPAKPIIEASLGTQEASGVYERFSDDQLETIKRNLEHSLAEAVTHAPDERRYGGRPQLTKS